METTILFQHVTKQYRLGLTRTSLPSAVSSWMKQVINHKTASRNRDINFLALRDVSFDLKRGDSLALVGSNGAGKTTILKLLANITKPTSGSININGKLSALIELGAGFHPDLTGRENIYLNGTILGLSRNEITKRFDEIVAFSELDQFIDTPVKRYSSGMAVRLGFAVASCVDPEILLIDEVLAVGDSAFQQKCMERIHALIDNGTTILFVSHNLYLVQAVCRTAIYLEKGQVKYHGETKEAIDRYERDLENARAAKFRLNDSSSDASEKKDLEITRVEVLNPLGSSTDAIPNSQSIQIQIHYNAYKPIGKAQVSIFIRRSDGVTCCSMRTKLTGYDLTIGSGRGIVEANIGPLQLVTGTYFVEAWFLNESDSMAIVSRGGRSDWFYVKGLSLSYDNNNGIFEPHVSWGHVES